MNLKRALATLAVALLTTAGTIATSSSAHAATIELDTGGPIDLGLYGNVSSFPPTTQGYAIVGPIDLSFVVS